MVGSSNQHTKRKIIGWSLMVFGLLEVLLALAFYDKIINISHSTIWALFTLLLGYLSFLFGLLIQKNVNLFSFSKKDAKKRKRRRGLVFTSPLLESLLRTTSG
jgi:hypothetical protein